jgi:hypothetical protein
MNKIEHLKQVLMLEGFSKDLIDKLNERLDKMIIDINLVDQYGMKDEVHPSFNPNPYHSKD